MHWEWTTRLPGCLGTLSSGDEGISVCFPADSVAEWGDTDVRGGVVDSLRSSRLDVTASGRSRCHKESMELLQVEIPDHPVVALTDVRPQCAVTIATALSQVMPPDEHAVASIRAGIE